MENKVSDDIHPLDWEEHSIDQLKANSSGSIAIGPFGSRMKSESYVTQGIPIIRGNNLTDTKEFQQDFVYISEEMADSMPNCNVYIDDLVFPHRGSIGEVGIVTGDPNTRFMLSTSLMKLSVEREKVDPLFLFYFFRSPRGRYELLKNASTVGTPGIATPLTSLRAIHVPLPPLPEQRAIAHILGTLDDKIELNRRMNETLEAMARALFQSWFVDFDPVRARAEGREPEGMDAATAALFPDGFEESELGMVPRGWRVQSVGHICEFVYGKPLKAENRRPGNIPVYGANGAIGWHDEALVQGPGIVVGRKVILRVVTWVESDFFPIDTTFFVVPTHPKTSLYYLCYALTSLNLASFGADSAVPGLNRNIAYMTKMLAPPGRLIVYIRGTRFTTAEQSNC